MLHPHDISTHDGAFYESYADRKIRKERERIEQARVEASLNPDPIRKGRPRSIALKIRQAIIDELLKNGNQTETARKFGINRVTVYRLLQEHNLTGKDLPNWRPDNSELVAATTYLDNAVYQRIKLAARQRRRAIASEIRAALNKLYG